MSGRVADPTSTTETDLPLLIEFVAGTHIYREAKVRPQLPIVQNGPPGTFVVFADGSRVPLPTDQIVSADDSTGAARIGFGGMSFDGLFAGRLQFRRVHDLAREELLSPERRRKMTLEPTMVAAIFVQGKRAWAHGHTLQ